MLLDYLFEESPYKDFPIHAFELDHTGFNLPAKVLAKILEVKPSRVIEVGTWKGNSAFFMADMLRDAGLHFEMICVDTWLGSSEMWLKPYRDTVPERRSGLMLQHGFPTIYYQFLANVIKKGHEHRIVPFPNTSSIAHKVLKEIGYTAQFIYIDGNHDEFDVVQDLANYWDLLECGGIMCGDDYLWYGVNEPVKKHIEQHECLHGLFEDEFSWWIQKIK